MSSAATIRTVNVGGVDVSCTLSGFDGFDAFDAFDERGIDERGMGGQSVDPVILLAGIGGTAASDFSFLLPLLARTRPVLAVDLGYGGGSGRLDGLVDQLAGVLSAVLPGRRVSLVGFSVGATVGATRWSRPWCW
jgi:pimeloyl-ACP methyl ester carboxylesterase